MNIKSAHFISGTNKRLGDKYLLLECLGDGSHGWVWRAERLKDGEIVAVKIPKDLTREDQNLAEGKELLNVEAHPNIVQVYDMGRVENEWFYIEMEYFPSQTLAQKLEQRGSYFGNTFERLFKIYHQVLEAIAYLSALPKPISHGDIKPHNILVGANDIVKLTDFGSSALPEEIYFRTRENGGTVLYSAPEFSNVECRRGSHEELLSGDIYSLGVLLYQLLTGLLPHDTPAQVQRHSPFKKPSEVNSSVSPAMESVVLTCMQKYPEQRFKTITELQADFLAARREQGEQPTYVSPLPQQTKSADWSTVFLRAMEEKAYVKAAKIAAAEFARSNDYNVLLQQLTALYRAERFFDFEAAFTKEKPVIMQGEKEIFSAIRLLAIKAFLELINIDEAKILVNANKSKGDDSIDLQYLEATLLGINAEYEKSRELLENINRLAPRRLNVLKKLIQVCEQMRDFTAASGYLRVALRMTDNEELKKKREFYARIGVL